MIDIRYSLTLEMSRNFCGPLSYSQGNKLSFSGTINRRLQTCSAHDVFIYLFF